MAIRKPIPKTQKEISIDQQQPSSTRYGNPNITLPSNENPTGIPFNRSEKISRDGHNIKPFAIFNYIPEENENYIEANDLDNLVCLCH